MATSGPNQSGTVAEFDDGWSPWTNDANAITFDQAYATTPLDSGETALSNYLDWTTFGTFAGIGAGDTVTHVEIEWAGKTSGGNDCSATSVQLIVGGVVVGTETTLSIAEFTGTESYISSGAKGVVGDFATTLNGSQLTSTFGVRVQFKSVGALETLSIDACRITLTYTPSASPATFSPVTTAGFGGG